MKNFATKLNQLSPRKIDIVEYRNPETGETTEDSFRKMIESTMASGAYCDGLVISGHHTGSFGGGRANGSLQLEFMEKLACDPKYSEWFLRVHSLWLQGCRTLGVRIVPGTTHAEHEQADFHTLRVGAQLNADHLDQDFAQLNMEFSATLDQDNPLSSRELRVFPAAGVFGWTQTAPGEGQHSEYSIPYHIAHVARLVEDRKDLFENPVFDKLSEKTAAVYADVLGALLSDRSKMPLKCQEDFRQGWLNHGQPKHGQYGLENGDLDAYLPLFTTQEAALLKAREDDCRLKNEKNSEELLKLIGAVASDETNLRYNFNSVWEVLQRLKESQKAEDAALLKQIQSTLMQSQVVNAFLKKQFSSETLGLLRKIDYYSFYRDMSGQQNSKVEDFIRDAAYGVMTKDMYGDNRDDLSDYQQTILESLRKNGLFNITWAMRVLTAVEPGAPGFSLILGEITKDKAVGQISPLLAKSILEKAIKRGRGKLDEQDVQDDLVKSLRLVLATDSPVPGATELVRAGAEMLARGKSMPSDFYEIIQKSNQLSAQEKADIIRSTATVYLPRMLDQCKPSSCDWQVVPDIYRALRLALRSPEPIPEIEASTRRAIEILSTTFYFNDFAEVIGGSPQFSPERKGELIKLALSTYENRKDQRTSTSFFEESLGDVVKHTTDLPNYDDLKAIYFEYFSQTDHIKFQSNLLGSILSAPDQMKEFGKLIERIDPLAAFQEHKWDKEKDAVLHDPRLQEGTIEALLQNAFRNGGDREDQLTVVHTLMSHENLSKERALQIARTLNSQSADALTETVWTAVSKKFTVDEIKKEIQRPELSSDPNRFRETLGLVYHKIAPIGEATKKGMDDAEIEDLIQMIIDQPSPDEAYKLKVLDAWLRYALPFKTPRNAELLALVAKKTVALPQSKPTNSQN